MNKAYNLNELLNANSETNWNELRPEYDYHKSFYGKALVKTLVNGVKVLMSYSTIVAVVLPNGKFLSNGEYSATTRRHEVEFANQYANDFDGNLKDYVVGKPFQYSGYNW